MDDFTRPPNYWFSSPKKHLFVSADQEVADWLQDEFEIAYRSSSAVSDFNNVSKEEEQRSRMYFFNFSENELENIRNIPDFADFAVAFSETEQAKEYIKGFISTYKTKLLRSLLIEQTPLGFAAFSDYADEKWIPKSPAQGSIRLWDDARYDIITDDVMGIYQHTQNIYAKEFLGDLHSYRTKLVDEEGLEDKIIFFGKQLTNQLNASHPKEREFVYTLPDKHQ